MTEFKGTKGEWYIRFMNMSQSDDGECDVFIEAKEPKSHIGKIEVMMDDYGDHSGYPREQKIADARAISQVPEMVKLLINIVESEDVNLNNVHSKAIDLLTEMKVI